MINIFELMNEEQTKIYQKYKDKFPFKIVEFINELGIGVRVHTEGLFKRYEKNPVIYVSDAYPITHARYTLARELGLYFEKMYYYNKMSDADKISRISMFNNPIFNNPNDRGANNFAAELLMPEAKFIEVWQKKTSPEKVAKFFKVSVEAVKIRASNLLGEIF